MGLFRWLNNEAVGHDLIRLEVSMDYSEPITGRPGHDSKGRATVRWITLDPGIPPQRLHRYRAALIASLYAEVLIVNSETRLGLMSLVDKAVAKARHTMVIGEKNLGFDFDEWNIYVNGLGLMPIWPWVLMEADQFNDWLGFFPPATGNPKTYTATLRSEPPTRKAPAGLCALIDMPGPDLTKVCVPSAPLIASYDFGQDMNASGHLEHIVDICSLLEHVNRYYRTHGEFAVGTHALALASAMSALTESPRSDSTL
jgi:hypothetical protein